MLGYLTLDLVLQIFYKLPIKCLIKCTSVCKSWNSIINSPNFISTHLTERSNTTGPLLILRLCLSGKEQYSVHLDNADLSEFMRLYFPFKTKFYFRIVGSYNGLLCLYDERIEYGYHDKIIFWNPSIRKFFSLPQPNITSNVHHRFVRDLIGFSFNPITNDYIVLRLSPYNSYCSKNRMSGQWTPHCCHNPLGKVLDEAEIYSFKANSWRSIISIAPQYLINGKDVPASLNGALHWIAHKKNGDNGCMNLVSVFDVKDEAFHEIMLPQNLMNVDPLHLSVTSFMESSIAVVWKDWSFPSRGDTSIWVMKEYGMEESWVKLLEVNDKRATVLGFRKNGEVLMGLLDGRVVSIVFQTQETIDLRICGSGFSFVDRYVESLVLLGIGDDTEEDIAEESHHANPNDVINLLSDSD